MRRMGLSLAQPCGEQSSLLKVLPPCFLSLPLALEVVISERHILSRLCARRCVGTVCVCVCCVRVCVLCVCVCYKTALLELGGLDEEVRCVLENEAYYKRNTCIKYQTSTEFWGLTNILCNPQY